jgi:Zn-dependent membrane protease YugP
MTSARLSRGQLVALVVIGITLFLLGFLIGYFTIPNDDADTTRRTIEELRRDEMHKKEQYHSKLYKSLNKAEIGKNLRYV